MPADPLYPAEVGPEPRPEGQFRADLVRYLDSLGISELGSLLSELPRTRTDMLMIELNQRLPDPSKLLPPAGTPGPGEGQRRTLRERIADRRVARTQPQAGPPDVVDRHRGRAGVTPRPADPTTRARLQDSVRALGEEAEANHAELEQRGMVAPTQVVAWSLPELHAGRMVARRDRTPGASAERRGRLQEALAWPAAAGRVQPRQVLAADLTSPPVPELLACQDPAATDADALLARAEHAYRQDRGWAAPRLPSDSSTTSNWSQQPTRPRPAGPMWGGGGGPADTQASRTEAGDQKFCA